MMLHIVGCFAFIGGLVLFLLTGLSAMILGFSGGSLANSFDLSNFVRGALTIALALTMSAILASFGLRFMRLQIISLHRQELRLTWTAFVLGMAICCLAAFWLNQPLAMLAGLMLLLLLAIRPVVLRLI